MELAVAQAGEDGTSTAQVRVPADARRGPHGLAASGAASGAATSERLAVAGR